MKSGDFSDLAFSCNEEKFKVHKNVVCGQSPVIKAALSKTFEEGHSNVIKMHDFEPRIVKSFIEFLYTGNYGIPKEGEEDNRSDNDGGHHVAKVDAVATVGDVAGGDDGQDGDDGHDGHIGDDGHDSDEDVEGDEDKGGKEDESEVADAQPRMTRDLATHIKVNSIGDYYGVTNLVSLANSNIGDLIQDAAENDDSATWVMNLPSAIELAVNTGIVRVFQRS
ncbi:hypothetical protein CDD80_2268 [Ophiocordyceps camponoti-rufipedis]|uniref:BTB domain-containing protein n=1 Tax=Ophiocordyceps camponoti-rufipedis TaxID=2004952 RepID=A0A2C5Z3G5_9HYPO|nr:hypothetical protein CDD80_2268 [Ophiocordyceps camponoti-rufipedis]